MTMQPHDERVSPQDQVLNLLAQMHQIAGDTTETHKLSDQLEVLVRSHMAPIYDDHFPGMRLSKTGARIMARLMRDLGKPVPYTLLMDAVYFDKPTEAADNILKVMICKLRQKLKASGLPFDIATIWGVGYSLNQIPQAGKTQEVINHVSP